MFTDIVGSTSLIEAIGDDAWSDLLAWHDATLRQQIRAHFGREVDHTGDGFFVAFGSAEAAVRCAECIQRKLSAHRRSQGFAPRVRIGVHLDEATSAGENFEGRGVHLAARVGAEARGDEVLVSRPTLDAAGGDFAPGAARTVPLKGFAEPMELVSVAWV
jgi:class 3 adenylate cyclase